MSTNPPQHTPRFDTIFFPDGSCGVASSQGDCHKPGVILAYDVFCPEIGTWFCSEHWTEFDVIYNIVEDKRPLVLFFQAVANIAAMKIVEDIFHNQEASDFAAEENDHAESDYHWREIERLESFLEEADYSYIGINNMVYLYKEDDVIAKLDTDDYTWKRADEGFNPIAAANALIDAIANNLKDKRTKEIQP